MPRLDSLFKSMMQKEASDLFVSSGAPPFLKIDGEMVPADGGKLLSNEVCEKLLFELLTDEQRNVFQEKGDLDFAYEIPEVARFRGNIFLQRRGISGVFRFIPAKVKPLSELNMPDVVGKLSRTNRGLILVTGATGSGKSTTLAAMIDVRNRESAEHILTLEDPLEFVHENKKSIIHQRQIGEHTNSFASSLRAALREAPDVILVGEMRDLETISLAITAAETGHLVYGTLHTSSAPKTVDRIIDAFPEEQQNQIRTMLADTLQGVISQHLLKRADKKGRIAALEVMINNSAIANLIREGKTFQIHSAIQTGKKEGMMTLDQHLTQLMMTKQIFAEEAFRHAHNKNQFLKYVMPQKDQG
ncbi:MAG: type IV pilus twitching motility protein PilT [bacterium]